MDSEALNHHLSRIETHWTAVFQAHQGLPTEAAAAQAALVRRYGGAVHRYLLASLRDAEAADDLAQEFALRFFRGDFRNADPGQGGFRDFLKRAVYHLMVDYHRSRRSRPCAPGRRGRRAGPRTPIRGIAISTCRFLESWRDQLMALAWTELGRVQEWTGQPFADVLRLRVENADLRSPNWPSELIAAARSIGYCRLGPRHSPPRPDMFVESLLGEVEQSLRYPSPERLEEELIDLGLLEHCRSVLKRRRGAAGRVNPLQAPSDGTTFWSLRWSRR